MKPLKHALASVKRYGGTVDDYLPIHTLIDEPKGCFADVRHRAILHNSFGPFLVMRVFGPYIEVDGKKISTRQIAEDHIVEDLGRIPTVEEWLRHMPREPWMDRLSFQKSKRRILDNWKNID